MTRSDLTLLNRLLFAFAVDYAAGREAVFAVRRLVQSRLALKRSTQPTTREADNA